MILQLFAPMNNPTDGTVAYFGAFPGLIVGGSSSLARVYVPRSGIIRACFLYIYIGTTLGSAETATASIRINDTTDILVSNTVTYNATSAVFSNTGLSTVVAQGDHLQMKIQWPTWATDPQGVHHTVTIHIE